MARRGQRVQFPLENASARRIGVRVAGSALSDDGDIDAILELVALQDDLFRYASEFDQLNRILGDEIPAQLQPRLLRAWVRQAVTVAQACLRDVREWKGRYARALRLITPGSEATSDLHKFAAALDGELEPLQARVGQLRNVAGL